MNCIKHIVVACAVMLALTVGAAAGDTQPKTTMPPASTKTVVTYQTDIKPTLKRPA